MGKMQERIRRVRSQTHTEAREREKKKLSLIVSQMEFPKGVLTGHGRRESRNITEKMFPAHIYEHCDDNSFYSKENYFSSVWLCVISIVLYSRNHCDHHTRK